MPRTITLALVQSSVPSGVDEALEAVRRSLVKARDGGAGLVLLPDLSLLPFFPQRSADMSAFAFGEAVPGGRSCEALQALARELGIAIGATIYEKACDGVYYDTGVIIDRGGNLRLTQHMMHIPEEPGFHEKYYYKPGITGFPVVEVDGVKIGMAVGQDHFFPETHRMLVLHGAELVLVPNAIAAVTDPLVLSSQASAVMNHLYVAVANRIGRHGIHEFIGRSHIAGPDGNLLAQAPDEECVVVHTLDLDALALFRRSQNYWLRDRRPDSYGDLVKDVV